MPSADRFHVAGVLVRGAAPALRSMLQRLPGVDLHTSDAARRCVVLTIEGASVDELLSTHRAIACLPGVEAADLVCHLVDDPPADAAAERS